MKLDKDLVREIPLATEADVSDPKGGSGLAHKARGRESNRSLNVDIRKHALELVKTRW
jgi:hypothetical protein